MAERNDILSAFATIATTAAAAVKPATDGKVGIPPGTQAPQGWLVRVFFHADEYEWVEGDQDHILLVVVSLIHIDDESDQALGTTELLRASAAFDAISDAIWTAANTAAYTGTAFEGLDIHDISHDTQRFAGIQVDGLDDADRRCNIGEVFRVTYRRSPGS